MLKSENIMPKLIVRSPSFYLYFLFIFFLNNKGVSNLFVLFNTINMFWMSFVGKGYLGKKTVSEKHFCSNPELRIRNFQAGFDLNTSSKRYL